MGWSRARVTDTIPLGCYMIEDQVYSKFLVFKRSLYNPDLVSIGLRGVFSDLWAENGPFLVPTDIDI